MSVGSNTAGRQKEVSRREGVPRGQEPRLAAWPGCLRAWGQEMSTPVLRRLYEASVRARGRRIQCI